MILLYPLGLIWALPFSLLGLFLALVTLSRPYTTRGPALVFRMGPVMRWAFDLVGFPAAATTWGCCMFTRDFLIDRLRPIYAAASDKRLVRHELEHVFQAMRWGPLFPFLYLGSMAVSYFQGKSPYRDSYFERKAREAEVRP